LRVLALGGAGDFGLRALRLLAANGIVSEITVAGRSLEKAKSAAAVLGEKAKASAVDTSDLDKLVSLARTSDLLLNTAGPEWEVVLKALRAAIQAGTNYCDLCAHNPTIEEP
jgi:saccharopine dehydrogenase-like NADP-dependent oxidoreductase